MERFNALGKFEFMDNGVFVIFGTTVGDNYNDFTNCYYDMFTASKPSNRIKTEIAYNLYVMDYLLDKIADEFFIVEFSEDESYKMKKIFEEMRDSFSKTIGKKYEKYFKLVDYSFIYLNEEIYLTEDYLIIDYRDGVMKSVSLKDIVLDEKICNDIINIVDKIVEGIHKVMGDNYGKDEE